MDDRRFDALARSLASGSNRRQLLKGMLGIGGAAIATVAALPDQADAARRGHSGPVFPTPCVPTCDGTTCGANGCGGTCRCDRSIPICMVEAEVCFSYCDSLDPSPCGIGCLCDGVFQVCISEQTFGGCAIQSDCPTGTFCYNDETCRAPCTGA